MFNLYQGDCLEIMKNITHETIDLTVTSPPYDNLRTYNNNNQWNQDKWKSIIKELFKVTKTGGVVVWVVNDATINGSETGTSFKQALHFMGTGFNLHDTMIWNKKQFSVPNKTRYHQTFEYMFIFSKGKLSCFNPIIDKKNKYAGKIRDGNIRKPDGEITKRNIKIVSEYGKRYNVWDIPAETHRAIFVKHPAIFPEKLVHDHIISWSNEGDLILDPFMGSGTTGMVCKQLNRDFIGIELDENYFRTADSEINQTNFQLKLLEPFYV